MATDGFATTTIETAAAGTAPDAMRPEPIRMVIWDLDETFWSGTLSEGGMAWVQANAETVIELSRRGIVNSICSKNDFATVEAILKTHSLRDHFVFPSIDWTAKGPRLASLVGAVQLRPQTVLFIDDNPLNRAEAAHYVPGLQIADEAIVPGLLADPRCKGKPDPDFMRLAQYRLLEQRHGDARRDGGDTTAFLRESRITISIDFDVAAEIDRAIELINRTNQLNFTKARLPEDLPAARQMLQKLLAHHTVRAGLVRVRDRYGDYGICGIYIARPDMAFAETRLLHFAFSCRILGMGVETWLYRQLNRPLLRVVGDVATDIFAETPVVDWLHVELPGLATSYNARERELPGLASSHNAREPASTPDAPARIPYVMTRGGCDMRAIGHYLEMVSDRVVEEAAGIRNGLTHIACSSLVAAHAIRGAHPDFVADCTKLGYEPGDFQSLIADPPAEAGGIWLLNFTLEQSLPVLRHVATGSLVHVYFTHVKGPPLNMLKTTPEQSGLAPDLVDHMRQKFEMVGHLPDKIFDDALRLILGQAQRAVSAQPRVFILLANEERVAPDGTVTVLEAMRNRNAIIANAAPDFPCAELISPAWFMSREESSRLEQPHHYDRLVYFRIFQHIIDRVRAATPASAAPPSSITSAQTTPAPVTSAHAPA